MNIHYNIYGNDSGQVSDKPQTPKSRNSSFPNDDLMTIHKTTKNNKKRQKTTRVNYSSVLNFYELSVEKLIRTAPNLWSLWMFILP